MAGTIERSVGNDMLFIIAVTSSLLSLVLVVIRLVEAIYELRKTPELDTFQECVQVVKNFFKMETYHG